MAGLYRVEMGVIQRSKGQSAMEKSAYQRRTSTADESKDWSSEANDFVSAKVLLPPSAPQKYQDPDFLWKVIEQKEKRRDSQLARTFEISIPDEVPCDLWKVFTEKLLDFFVEHGFAVGYAIHQADGTRRQKKNPHFHAVVSMRRLSEHGFSDKKDRVFTQVMRSEGGLYFPRITAESMNAFFTEHGIDLTVDYRRKEDPFNRLPRTQPSIMAEIKRIKKAFVKHQKDGGSVHEFRIELSESAQNFLLYYNEQKANFEAIKDLQTRLDEVHAQAAFLRQGAPALPSLETNQTAFGLRPS